MNKYALISVTDKSKLELFSKELINLGYSILSTGGTARFLSEHGIPYVSVGEYTGQEEILDGRVKTLHPKIHSGILARRGNEKDQLQMKNHGFNYIDLVAVNLYPFKNKKIEFDSEDSSLSLDDMIEFIDIGGPTLLRASAKNFTYVYSVVDPNDYSLVIRSLQESNSDETIRFRKKLASKVFATTSSYDLAIANFLGRDDIDNPNDMSSYSGVILEKVEDLRYGENPHQLASWYEEFGLNSVKNNIKQIQGKELSYNNINDLSAALKLSLDLDSSLKSIPHSVIVKHANPCGVSVSNKLIDAVTNSISCDPVSAFGGIVSLNREVNEEVANLLCSSFYEIIIAPAYSEKSLSIFSAKKNLRVIKCDLDKLHSSRDKLVLRDVGNSFLLQTEDGIVDNISSFDPCVGSKLSDQEQLDSQLAWITVKHVKSNAIVIAKNNSVIGIGAGQMNRLDSTKLALIRATRNGFLTSGSVAASDAFFPFSDNIIELANAGVTVIIQPGGSIRDNEVIEEVSKAGIKMILTNRRHFNH